MFRFSIRDVLWLTVVVALACGWCLNLSREVAQRMRLLEVIQRLQADNEQLKADVRLLNEKAVLTEAFVLEQRERAEAQRQEAIARLKERGYKFPRAFEEELKLKGQGADSAQ